jgi:hypothetical protein
MASTKVTEPPSSINWERGRNPHGGALRSLFYVLTLWTAAAATAAFATTGALFAAADELILILWEP